MTKHYTVTSPDGHEYDIDAPDEASQSDVLQHAQQQHTQGAAPADPSDNSMIGTGIAGLAQGAIVDPIEGIGQLAEHIPYVGAIPRAIGRSAVGTYADRLRDYARSTTTGQIGELGGEIGSMFIPLGGLARAAGFAGDIGRAAEAGEAGLQGVRSATQAGPWGYAAVRRALENPGDIGKRAVQQATSGPEAGKAPWTAVQDYFPGPARGPVRPSTARPAFETPNAPTVGPPTLGERARLAATDAATRAGKRMKIVAHRHPVLAGAARGAAGAAAQPVEGARSNADYWDMKRQQMAGGAVAGSLAASPLARRIAAHLATHGTVHGLGMAAAPHAYWLHWPLHHLARRAGYVAGHAAGSRKIGQAGQRAAGAAAGWALKGQPDRLYVSPNREEQP